MCCRDQKCFYITFHLLFHSPGHSPYSQGVRGGRALVPGCPEVSFSCCWSFLLLQDQKQLCSSQPHPITMKWATQKWQNNKDLCHRKMPGGAWQGLNALIGDCCPAMNLSKKNLTFQLLISRFLTKTPSFSLLFSQKHHCLHLQSLYSCTGRKRELRDVLSKATPGQLYHHRPTCEHTDFMVGL